MWIVIIILLAAGFAYVPLPYVWGRWQKMSLARQSRKKRAVALTFDDGPGNRLTPAILDILAQAGVKATFFVLGRNIAGREELLLRLAKEGHEIGVHGFEHIDYQRAWPWRSIADIRRGRDAIGMVLGKNWGWGRYLFRPPNGRLNIFALMYLWLSGAAVVYWTADSSDTWAPAQRAAGQIAQLVRQTGGAVTLAHDFDRTTDRSDEMVLEAVRQVLAAAQQDQLTVVKVSRLLGDRN